MPRRLVSLAVTFAALSTTGCGDPPPPVDAATPDAGTDASAASPGVLVRAAEGGRIESEDGLFAIYVFPGALSTDTTISITRVADADVPADVRAESPISAVYSVEPDGLTFGGDGAWAHYRFDSPPAGTITMVDGVPAYASLDARARSGASGALDSHEIVVTSYDLTASSVDVITRLSHLSLQWAVGRLFGGEGSLRVEMGAPTQTVGTPWATSDTHVTYPRTLDGRPIVSASIRGEARYTVSLGHPSLGEGPDDGLLDAVIAHFGVVPDTDELTSFQELHEPTTMGAAHVSWEAMEQRFVCSSQGPGQALVNAYVSYADRVEGGLQYSGRSVQVHQRYDCVAAAASARVTHTTPCVREDTAVTCDAAPVLTAEVTAEPETTTTVVLAASPYYMTLVPAADPPADGPDVITATNGAATVTATETPTGEYDEVVDNEPAWAADVPTLWTAGGAFSTTSDPVADATFHFGELAGLTFDVVIDEEPTEGDIEVRVTRPGEITCAGAQVRDLEIVGIPEIEELADGTRGYAAPVQRAIDAAAAYCGFSPTEFTSDAFTIDVGVSSTASIELPTTRVRVRTGSAARIDGASVLAMCPPGRTHCSGACVTLDTPMNCGGCGAMPAELCDGIDNDCDGTVDERCPNGVVVPSSPRSFSETFGVADGGSSLGVLCPTFTVMVGFCGNVDTTTGSIRSLRGQCASLALDTDRTSTPYTFAIRTTPLACGASGGGSSGGTPFSHTCGAGEVVDTISGMAGSDLGQFAFRCARLDVVNMGGLWHIVRGPTAMSSTFGTGAGSAFSWTVETDPTTGFPGALFGYDLTFAVPGTVHSLRASGAAPYLRVP